MPRYITRRAVRANDGDWYDAPLEPDLTVIERDPVPTGLLDAEGNEIWRTNDPIGFVHF